MKRFPSLLSFLTIILVLGLIASCDSVDNTSYSNVDDFQRSTFQKETTGAFASKLFDTTFEGFGSESFMDKNDKEWELSFTMGPDNPQYVSDGTSIVQTLFVYDLYIPDGASNGSHFALQIPECAALQFNYGATTPEGGINDNANGTIEWNPADLSTGSNPITFAFDGFVDFGVVDAGFKTAGSGGVPENGQILGPCQGVYTVEGFVFLDSPGNGRDVPPDGIFDPSTEPGIQDVVVEIQEEIGDLFAPIGWSETDETGYYSFKVLGPPITDENGIYKVEIKPSVPSEFTDAINASLFDEILFDPAFPVDNPADVDVTSPIFVDFGFAVNVGGAIAAFDNNTLFSDGLPRAYWKVQATGHGSPKYDPEFDSSVVSDMLPAIASFGNRAYSDWLFFATLSDIIDVLKNESKGDVADALFTEIVTALLNYNFPELELAVGTEDFYEPTTDPLSFDRRGICSFGLNEIGRCADPGFDDDATRFVIEHGLSVLEKAGYLGFGKVPPGSVGEGEELVSRVNNNE